MKWMLYGAYGYTGVLIAEEAVKRGHQPLLAGRNAEKLKALADRLELPYIVLDLDDTPALEAALSDVDVVLHSAGPFTFTGPPMRKACLKTRTHYLDITGEISVFENTFLQDELAKQAGILMISGVGFDVVPSDSLALHIKNRLPDATSLEIGLKLGSGGTQGSAGTLKSFLEIIADGNLVRRDGKLSRIPFGSGVKKIDFGKKSYLTIPIPWGDIATAYRTTGIPNIITYMAFPPALIRSVQVFGIPTQWIASVKPTRRVLQRAIDFVRKDRSASMGDGDGKAYIWMRASNDKGESVESRMETKEGYLFTAISCVRIIEKIQSESPPTGALSPAQYLGADFVLDIEGTQRFDD